MIRDLINHCLNAFKIVKANDRDCHVQSHINSPYFIELLYFKK